MDFHEADILWPEDCGSQNHSSRSLPSTGTSSFTLPASHNPSYRRLQQQQKPHTAAASAPIGIPPPAGPSSQWSFRVTRDAQGSYWVEDEEVDIDAEEGHHGQPADVVPPHLLLSSRQARAPFHHKMAFSVCTGHGRTLKGRDLSQLRDLVLRLTGFLEPEA